MTLLTNSNKNTGEIVGFLRGKSQGFFVIKSSLIGGLKISAVDTIVSVACDVKQARVDDIVFAKKGSNLAKIQMLHDPAIGLLSQANKVQQNVLSLLR